MKDNKLGQLKAAMEALNRLEAMLDDMDVKSTEGMRQPESPGDGDREEAPSDSETDGSLAPDESAETLGDEDESDSAMSDELSEMAEKGNLGAKGAMDFFKKKSSKPDDEDEANE